MRRSLIAALPLAICLGSAMDLQAQEEAANSQKAAATQPAQKAATTKATRC